MSESWTWDWYYWNNFFSGEEIATINKFIEMGAEQVNEHKIYIKFQCTENLRGDPA